ncbi:ChbG/HpnK family deacetylase [Catenovulum sp. SM1970]|uniref:ChbG/HpnK family deacetylase n=1 Tax=Marinifaba aquimaris TaxID=2741323 RepID=UPI0015733814|nr:ChbG/HpnK family deacetylase [Marinifaba aquimaris]NTS76272.1 ChbG/HpnK family deacetylase [Marinifaba aquimaris]
MLKLNSVLKHWFIGLSLILFTSFVSAKQLNGWDVLVVAPHPDDETLGTAGTIMQALKAGKKVGVVVLTNGDVYPLAASKVSGIAKSDLKPDHFVKLGSERQQYVAQALKKIDFPLSELHFLAYPDGGLLAMYQADNARPYTSEQTQQSTTYQAYYLDYRTKVSGRSAPYTKAALLQDLTDIIASKKPSSIYVTSQQDGHPDHQAAYLFTAQAAKAAGYQGVLNTYLVHAKDPDATWPYPLKPDFKGLFVQQKNANGTVPANLIWPPQKRTPLTEQQAIQKQQMIESFNVEMQTAAEYMLSFVKGEEVFWPESVKADKKPELLIRVDDVGMSHAVNLGVADFIKTGIPFSASAMVPTPWFSEAVEILSGHQHVAVGLHLTLTSEFKQYKWGPTAGADNVPSIVNKRGEFYPSVREFLQSDYLLSDIEIELRAQVKKAIEMGLEISYVDHHMGIARATPEIAQVVEKVAADYGLAVSRYYREAPINLFHYSVADKPPAFFKEIAYLPTDRLNMFVMHPARDNPELAVLTDMNSTAMLDPLTGLSTMSKHRQAELDALLSPEFLAMSNNIKFVTYLDLVKQKGLASQQRGGILYTSKQDSINAAKKMPKVLAR